MGKILINSQNKAYIINNKALEIEPMTLIREWNGLDAPIDNKWYDKVDGQYWMLTSATHTNGYYQFLNSDATSANSYAMLNGILPDLGYHFKIEIIFEINDQSNNTGYNVVVDFGSITQTSYNSCAFALYSSSHNIWGMNSKLNGNDSTDIYNIVGVQDNVIPDTWIYRKIAFGVRSSEEIGKDECFMIVDNVGIGATETPFTPIQMNRWSTTGQYYIARSSVTPSANFPYSSNIRIYSIKIYKE